MDQMIEVYKVFITIGVALVSVTITAYTIAISLLGSEKARLQARIDDIRRRATERIKRGEIKDYEESEKQVDGVREESRNLLSVLSSLSLKNVVLMPSLCFAMSIGLAAAGIFRYPILLYDESTVEYWRLSFGFLVLGIIFLVNALRAIERAAGQPRTTGILVEPQTIPTVGYQITETMPEKEEIKEVKDYLRRLKALADDFHDLALRADSQDKDIRMVTIAEVSFPPNAPELAARDKEIRLQRESIRSSYELINAWFDEFSERLKQFIENPKILQKQDLADLILGFKRLVYEHYVKVIIATIHFVNKFGGATESAIRKFREVKSRQLLFVDKTNAFTRDLRSAGYQIGEGFELEYIKDELSART